MTADQPAEGGEPRLWLGTITYPDGDTKQGAMFWGPDSEGEYVRADWPNTGTWYRPDNLSDLRPAVPVGDEVIENTPEQVRAWTLGYLAGKRPAAPVAVDEATVARDEPDVRCPYCGAEPGQRCFVARGYTAGHPLPPGTAHGARRDAEVVRVLAARDESASTHQAEAVMPVVARAVEQARRDALEEALAVLTAGWDGDPGAGPAYALAAVAAQLRRLTDRPRPARDDDYGPNAGQL